MKPQEFRKICKGVFVMMTTPFHEDRTLDLEGVRTHVKYILGEGIKTGNGVLVPVGSTGECPMMTLEEKKLVMDVVMEEAKGLVPVMPTCNSCDTREAIEMVQYAEKIGAAGVMCSPHYYWKPTYGMLYEHFKAIADSTNLGIVIDNCNFATGADISVSSLEKLVEEIPQIIGFKENSSDIGKWDEECRILDSKVNFIAGNADCHWPYVALIGSVGMISAMANFIPARVLEIWEACEEGDFFKAKKLHRTLMPISLFNSRIASEKYKSFIKEMMMLMGIPAGPTRLPLVQLSSEEKEKAKEVALQLNLIK
ncbi:MAG: dihydrodipicolinate synthase family protein [Sphaerochaetaceae bacterium]